MHETDGILFCDICNKSVPRNMDYSRIEGKLICEECKNRLIIKDKSTTPIIYESRSKPESKYTPVTQQVKVERPKEGLFLQSLNCGCAVIFGIIILIIILALAGVLSSRM